MSTDLDVPEPELEALDRRRRRRRSAREAVATWRAALANDAGDLLAELMRHRAALVVQELEEGDLVRSRLSRLVGRAELRGAAYGPRDVAAELADAQRQLHDAREIVDDLHRTRAREGREADEALAGLAAAIAEAERQVASRPRPPRTIITIEGDVVSIRETA